MSEPKNLKLTLSHFSCVYHGEGIVKRHVLPERLCDCCGAACSEEDSDGEGAGVRYLITPHYKRKGTRKTLPGVQMWACRICFIMWDDGCDENGDYAVG